MMTQATLVEQNADLLSFIAKKERKCLDLREGASEDHTCDRPIFLGHEEVVLIDPSVAFAQN